MGRFQLPEDPDQRRALKALYEEMGYGDRPGMPNFWSGMALRPDLMRGAWALTQAMLQGQLTDRQRELVLAGVAARNKAHYCCLTHAANLRKLGVPEAEVDSVTHDPDFRSLSPEDRRIVAFAVQVSQAPNAVGEGAFRGLRAAGLRDEVILELVLLAAFANWSNTWSSAADVILD